MSVNIDRINNVVTGYDNAARNSYNLFSFIDDNQNEYHNPVTFEKEIIDMFTNFRPYVLSEDSNKCSIANIDRTTYTSKLNQLNSILTTCNNSNLPNKDECIYNEFIKPETIQNIKDLTTIISKINKDCILNNVVAEEKASMCNSVKTEMFNNYSNDKIQKNYDFINKYSSIIVQLKNIADTNLLNYMTTCNQNPERMATYNNVQNLLAKALFETKICQTCPRCPEEKVCTPITKDTCLANPEISANINELKLDKEKIQTENDLLKKSKDTLETEKTNLEKELQEVKDNADSFVWDTSFSARNGWIFFGIILILLIIVGVLGYFSSGRKSRDETDNQLYNQAMNNQMYNPAYRPF
jgi:hypothetical protein